MIRSAWFWHQVSKVIPEAIFGLILLGVGLIGVVCSVSAFAKERRVSSLGWTVLSAVFLLVGVPMACDRQPASQQTASTDAQTTQSPGPSPHVGAAPRDQSPVDEVAIEQDLRKRAASAAKFLMEQMRKVADFRETVCVVNQAEVIRQPDNITVPYVGRVVLRVSDGRLDYTGQLNLKFNLQKHGWYLAEITASDYRVGATGEMASPGMMSTRDALPILQETHVGWITGWKAAYAMGKTQDSDNTSPGR